MDFFLSKSMNETSSSSSSGDEVNPMNAVVVSVW
jgi:hypothetical protein